jgi:hypothetical protein
LHNFCPLRLDFGFYDLLNERAAILSFRIDPKITGNIVAVFLNKPLKICLAVRDKFKLTGNGIKRFFAGLPVPIDWKPVIVIKIGSKIVSGFDFKTLRDFSFQFIGKNKSDFRMMSDVVKSFSFKCVQRFVQSEFTVQFAGNFVKRFRAGKFPLRNILFKPSFPSSFVSPPCSADRIGFLCGGKDGSEDEEKSCESVFRRSSPAGKFTPPPPMCLL